MEGFKYIIQKQERQKVCFGSGCPRDTSKKGMSPFMKHYTLEDHPNVSPNSYCALQSFKAITTKPCSHSMSKRGYSGIARFDKAIAIKDCYPSPATYNTSTFPKKVQESKYPFETRSKRQTFVSNTIPGPGMYNGIKRKRIAFEHSFGGKVKMKLGVDLKCCSRNTDVCKVCNQKMAGDYWHLKNETFLCRSCMNTEYEAERKYKRKELKQFQKVRDCSIMHQHANTTAKLWLMCPANAAEWIRRESYLSGYFSR